MVTVSSAVLPVRVSMPVAVRLLLPLSDNVSVSVPLAKLTTPLVMADPRVMVSAPELPVMVSELETVNVLAPLAKLRLSVPEAKS